MHMDPDRVVDTIIAMTTVTIITITDIIITIMDIIMVTKDISTLRVAVMVISTKMKSPFQN